MAFSVFSVTLFLRFFGHIVGPSPGTVQYTQDPNRIARDAIGDDIGCAANHQFPRLLDVAKTTALWEPCQGFDLRSDAVIHGDGGLRAVRYDVVEDRVAVGLREDGPLHPHDSARHGLSRLALRGGSALSEMG